MAAAGDSRVATHGPRVTVPVGAAAAGKIVAKIGRKARMVVDEAADKYATAHDLRRSFGTRWSQRVMPGTLQKLMRHADMKTTMAFYIHREADDLVSELWRIPGEGALLVTPPTLRPTPANRGESHLATRIEVA